MNADTQAVLTAEKLLEAVRTNTITEQMIKDALPQLAAVRGPARLVLEEACFKAAEVTTGRKRPVMYL